MLFRSARKGRPRGPRVKRSQPNHSTAPRPTRRREPSWGHLQGGIPGRLPPRHQKRMALKTVASNMRDYPECCALSIIFLCLWSRGTFRFPMARATCGFRRKPRTRGPFSVASQALSGQVLLGVRGQPRTRANCFPLPADSWFTDHMHEILGTGMDLA